MPNSMFIKTHFSKPINLSKHYKPYFSATFVGGSVMCDKCEDPEKCHEVVIVRRYTQNEFTSWASDVLCDLVANHMNNDFAKFFESYEIDILDTEKSEVGGYSVGSFEDMAVLYKVDVMYFNEKGVAHNVTLNTTLYLEDEEDDDDYSSQYDFDDECVECMCDNCKANAECNPYVVVSFPKINDFN